MWRLLGWWADDPEKSLDLVAGSVELASEVAGFPTSGGCPLGAVDGCAKASGQS